MAGFHTKTFLKHDDYMTPKYAFENIKQYIPKDKIIWEAFYGDIICSNPPFSKCKEIMGRLYELDKPFILILPASKITTSYFRRWKDKGIQIIIPRTRIHFTKKINGETPKNWGNKCNFDCFYYCYKMNLTKDIIWLE
jgi:hypothetical protein